MENLLNEILQQLLNGRPLTESLVKAAEESIYITIMSEVTPGNLPKFTVTGLKSNSSEVTRHFVAGILDPIEFRSRNFG